MPPVYAVMGEDDSDVEALKTFIKRLRAAADKRPPKVTILGKGYEGCAEMLRKAPAQLRAWEKAGVTRVVVSYDADRDDPAERMKRLRQVYTDSGITIDHCPLVPVQELEAWLLADVVKLESVFTVLRKKKPRLKPVKSPEGVADPKEHLVGLSLHPEREVALYHPPTHNVVMAEDVDLVLVRSKCPSFRPLVAFIEGE